MKKIEEKIKVKEAEILVSVAPSRSPYYCIKYLEVGEDEYSIGYSSYNLDYVFEWYNNCFEVVKEEMTPIEEIKFLKKLLKGILFNDPLCLEALNKNEKTKLEEIKNQKKYEKLREIADDTALVIKAFVDSGFSRSEAVQLASIGMQNYFKEDNSR